MVVEATSDYTDHNNYIRYIPVQVPGVVLGT